MAYIYRDFDVHGKNNNVNIHLMHVEDGVMALTFSRIYWKNADGRAYMRLTYPTQTPTSFYDICRRILDSITQDFRVTTYNGDKDCIVLPNQQPVEFKEENIHYLHDYPSEFDIMKIYVDAAYAHDTDLEYDMKSLIYNDIHANKD